MAQMRMYAIYDRAAEESGPLFEAKNDSVAIRSYSQLLERVAPHDRDAYRLYCVGTYDRDTMVAVPFSSPSEIDFERLGAMAGVAEEAKDAAL